MSVAWDRRVAGDEPPLAVARELFEALLTGIDEESGWKSLVSEPAYAFGVLRAQQGRDVTGLVEDILALRLLLWGHLTSRLDSAGDAAQLLLLHERLCEMLDLGLGCAVDAFVDESTRVLVSMATRDALTTVLNRSGFAEALAVALQAASTQAPLAVVTLDLDGFKAVNDTLGHLAGDDVLQVVSELLVELSPQRAAVARLGGDEFAMLVPDITRSGAGDVVGRILEATRVHPVLGRPEAPVRLSAGIVLLAGGLPAQDVLAAADEAMYAAKRAGGDRWVLAQGPRGLSAPAAATAGATLPRSS